MLEDNGLYEKAVRLEKLKQDQEAFALYDEFIKSTTEMLSSTEDNVNLKEKLALAYNNRGFIKYKKVDFDGAVEDYTSSLTIVQDSPVTYYNRGMIHYRLSRFDEAIKDMKSCLSLDPNFTDAKTGLSMSECDKEAKQNRQWFSKDTAGNQMKKKTVTWKVRETLPFSYDHVQK